MNAKELMKNREAFATKLRNFRNKSGLTQEELGHMAKLHRTYISEVEGAKRNISLDNIAKLAKVLKIEIKDFF